MKAFLLAGWSIAATASCITTAHKTSGPVFMTPLVVGNALMMAPLVTGLQLTGGRAHG